MRFPVLSRLGSHARKRAHLLWVRLWWKAAEVDPEVAVTPAVSVPKPRSSKGNWKGMVTGTRPPSIPKGVTFWFVTDKGDVMRVRGEALANNDAPAVDCGNQGSKYIRNQVFNLNWFILLNILMDVRLCLTSTLTETLGDRNEGWSVNYISKSDQYWLWKYFYLALHHQLSFLNCYCNVYINTHSSLNPLISKLGLPLLLWPLHLTQGINSI